MSCIVWWITAPDVAKSPPDEKQVKLKIQYIAIYSSGLQVLQTEFLSNQTGQNAKYVIC